MNTRQHNSESYKRVYVKISYTTTSATFYIYKHITMETFITSIKYQIASIMGLRENTYELVLCATDTQPGIKDEEKDAFVLSEPLRTVSHYFPTNMDTAFYIRLLNTDDILPNTTQIPSSSSSSLSTATTTQIIPQVTDMFNSVHECGICFNTENALSAYYVCGHLVCNSCYTRWQRTCPFCRSNTINNT